MKQMAWPLCRRETAGSMKCNISNFGVVCFIAYVQAMNMFIVTPTNGTSGSVNASTVMPISIKGCKLIPMVNITSAATAAVKQHTWAFKIDADPGVVNPAPYNKQVPVDFTLNFTKSSRLTNFTATGPVVLTNSYKKPIEIVRAAWIMRHADGTEQELPTEINCVSAANGTAVVPRSIMVGNRTQDGTLLCDWKVQVPKAHGGEMRLNVTTADGE
jgi:hypothetical protein